MIRPGLAELSDHIAWYPKMKKNIASVYKIDMELPEGYVAVTNCNQLSAKTVKENSLTTWESAKPVYGITLIAAPGLKTSRISRNGMTIEIYYSWLLSPYIESMKTDLLRSLELLTDAFGSPASEQLVRVVYSPRSAGAYARSPLIIVSENYSMEQSEKKFGRERDFHLNTHEIAHYWSLANVNTYDDWINEGLAEYSALFISETVAGKSFTDMMVAEYTDIVSNSPTKYSIAETPADSRDREVNRYYKPTLLLNDIRQKFGEQRMKVFLADLYANFKSKKATTSIFIDVLEKNYGKETSEGFARAIYSKEANIESGSNGIEFLQSDTAIIGTWSGPLTQFGATTKFVLNLRSEAGKLIPTLDSPDQNVSGIPLSEFKLTTDSISFKIGVASASYKGHIDRIKRTIQGEFIQRGGTYPLKLSK
jgi:hypothetical protein